MTPDLTHATPDSDGESGFTLIEMMVVVMLSSIFMGIVAAGIGQMSKVTTKMRSVGEGSAELSKAFLRLDQQVRYADAIDDPSQHAGTGDWYTSYRTAISGSSPTCTQLRLRAGTGELQERSWTSTGVAATPTGWRTIARNLKPLGAAPFTTQHTTASFVRQQLTISLQSTSADAKTSSETNLTFTAINSSAASVSNTGAYACPVTEVDRS